MIKLLNYSINDTFYDLVSSSKKDIKLCAPYVKEKIIDDIYNIKRDGVGIEIISSFNIGNFYKRSSDVDAFKQILENKGKVYNSQFLHAKFYIFDDRFAIITSANLTNGGFEKNLEYGVLIEDRNLVKQTINDYNNICSNIDTGKIKIPKINEIQRVLDNLPAYKDDQDSTLSNELDNIIDIDLNEVGSNLSAWKRLTLEVIEQIPNKEFTLSNIYEYRTVFKKNYPENNTIKDSIRRNLQELRDLGFIRFLGQGKYLKLWNSKRRTTNNGKH